MVGTVVSASFDGEKATVQWDLVDGAAGWASEHLINKNHINELSLKHVVYSDGNMEPVEVSLCKRGARPNTFISKNNAEYLNNAATPVYSQVIMASAEASIPQPPAAEVAAPVAAETAPAVAAAPAAVTDEPAAKKAKFDTPIDLINGLSAQVKDQDMIQGVIDFIANQMESNISTQNELAKMREMKEALEKAQQSHVDASKTVVKDIVDVLSSLYSNYAPNSQFSDEAKFKFAEVLQKEPAALSFAQPLMVAASAINARVGQAAAQGAGKAMDLAMSRIAALQSQLESAKGMRSVTVAATAAPVAAAVQPHWTPVAAPAPPPPPQAPVAVEVAAGHSQGFILPPILAGMTSFNAGGNQRITREMFSKQPKPL